MGREKMQDKDSEMIKPLIVWNPWYRSAVCYFGEHAKIMRMAFNIPEDCVSVVKREVLK